MANQFGRKNIDVADERLIDMVIDQSKELRCVATDALNDGVIYTAESNKIFKYYSCSENGTDMKKYLMGEISEEQSVVKISLVQFKQKDFLFAQTSDLGKQGMVVLPYNPFSYQMPVIAHNSEVTTWKGKVLYITTNNTSNMIVNYELSLVSLDNKNYQTLTQCVAFLTVGDLLYYITKNRLVRFGTDYSAKLNVNTSKISLGPHKTLLIGGKKLEPGVNTKQFMMLNRFLKVIDTVDHSTKTCEYTTVEVLKRKHVHFVIGLTRDCTFTMAATLRRRLFMVQQEQSLFDIELVQFPPTLMRTVILPSKKAICAICNNTNYGYRNDRNQKWAPRLFLLYPILTHHNSR